MLDVPSVAIVERLGRVGRGDAPEPHGHHRGVGQPEDHVGLAAALGEQAPLALQAPPEGGLRQRVEDVDREHGDPRGADELDDVVGGVGRVGVEAHDDAGDDLHAVAVDAPHRLEQGHPEVLVLGHEVERVGLRRLDPAEHRDEARLAHEREHALVRGDVQRRLAREAQRVAVAHLPLDQVRQEIERGLLVADEVVVHEVDAGGAAGRDPVELGQHLLRRLEARVAPVERRDVAELARVRAPARELDVGDEVLADVDQVVGRRRELGERQPLGGLEAELALRPARVRVEILEEPVRRVAELAQVQDVGVGVELGASRHRGPAEDDGLAVSMGARDQVEDLRALDVHARGQHRVRPAEVGVRGAPRVLVHEAQLPRRGQVRGDDEKPLGRHERADAAAEERIGMLEGPEGARVGGVDAEDATAARRPIARSHASA